VQLLHLHLLAKQSRAGEKQSTSPPSQVKPARTIDEDHGSSNVILFSFLLHCSNISLVEY
jgi:hypothetical protein